MKTKFYVYCSLGLLIVISFFIFGFYFNIWNRKFNELPLNVNIIYYLYIILTILYLIRFFKLLNKMKL